MLIGVNVSFSNGHLLSSLRLPHSSGCLIVVLKKWQFNFTFIGNAETQIFPKRLYGLVSLTVVIRRKPSNTRNKKRRITQIQSTAFFALLAAATCASFISDSILVPSRYFPCRGHARMKKKYRKKQVQQRFEVDQQQQPTTTRSDSFFSARIFESKNGNAECTKRSRRNVVSFFCFVAERKRVEIRRQAKMS